MGWGGCGNLFLAPELHGGCGPFWHAPTTGVGGRVTRKYPVTRNHVLPCVCSLGGRIAERGRSWLMRESSRAESWRADSWRADSWRSDSWRTYISFALVGAIFILCQALSGGAASNKPDEAG